MEESDKYTLVSNSSIAHACVCGQASYSHKFWIRPSSFGISNITVHAHSINNNISKICEDVFANVIASDAITKPILVKVYDSNMYLLSLFLVTGYVRFQAVEKKKLL